MRRSGRSGVLAGFALLLGACTGVVRTGQGRVYAQALDTESNVASLAASLRVLTQTQRAQLDEAILECVQTANFTLNEKLFGGNPSREQCAEVLERDSSNRPVTRAMRLGSQKHELALQCIQQKLQALRPGGFSLRQRYRLNPGTGQWEPLSRSQVESLLRSGGKELVGTLEPDIVIHAGTPTKVLVIYDLKFPCPGANPAQWSKYPEGHPHHGFTQGEMYERAFRVTPARVSPRWGIQ